MSPAQGGRLMRRPFQADPGRGRQPITPDDGASTRWRTAAHRAIRALAATGEAFGADELRACGLAEPPHPNHWGQAFSVARKAGVIVAVGADASSRASRARGLNRVWRGSSQMLGFRHERLCTACGQPLDLALRRVDGHSTHPACDPSMVATVPAPAP